MGRIRDHALNELKSLAGGRKSLGFYAGGLYYGVLLQENSIRYFDGDSFKHGKTWLRGLPPIESPANLKDRPVDSLVICPEHYYQEITGYLRKIGIPSSVKMYSLNRDIGDAGAAFHG
jgi:hypothetical protein